MTKNQPAETIRPLTVAQTDVLRLARNHPLVLIRGVWRVRGARSAIRRALVQDLLERGLLLLDDGRAVISPSGRAGVRSHRGVKERSGTDAVAPPTT